MPECPANAAPSAPIVELPRSPPPTTTLHCWHPEPIGWLVGCLAAWVVGWFRPANVPVATLRSATAKPLLRAHGSDIGRVAVPVGLWSFTTNLCGWAGCYDHSRRQMSRTDRLEMCVYQPGLKKARLGLEGKQRGAD